MKRNLTGADLARAMNKVDSRWIELAYDEEELKKAAVEESRAGRTHAGKLFGAVTSQEISDALKEQFDLDIDSKKIVQAEPIKNFGAYTVKAKLGFEVSGTINVLVVEG